MLSQNVEPVNSGSKPSVLPFKPGTLSTKDTTGVT